MRISLIINTACRDAAHRSNRWRSRTYAERADWLKRIAESDAFDEVIIVGSFPEPPAFKLPHLRWIAVPAHTHDRRDALWQRETGARFATGDVLVFTHDDHAPGEGFLTALAGAGNDWDLLVPKRLHGATGEELNNGRDDGYMGGHTLCMRRDLWARVPWTSVNTEYWDVPMTRIWREAGARIAWSDTLTHIDLEAREGEA